MKIFNTKQSHTNKGYTFFPTDRKIHEFNNDSGIVKELIWKNSLDESKTLHRYYLCERLRKRYIGDVIGNDCYVFLTHKTVQLISFCGPEKLIKERR